MRRYSLWRLIATAVLCVWTISPWCHSDTVVVESLCIQYILKTLSFIKRLIKLFFQELKDWKTENRRNATLIDQPYPFFVLLNGRIAAFHLFISAMAYSKIFATGAGHAACWYFISTFIFEALDMKRNSSNVLK